METDPERPQTLALPHFPSFFFLAGVKKETHYAERTLSYRLEKKNQHGNIRAGTSLRLGEICVC